MPEELKPQIACPKCDSDDSLDYYKKGPHSRFYCTQCGLSELIRFGIGSWSNPFYAEYRRIERDRARRSRKRVIRFTLRIFGILVLLISLIIASILGFFVAIIYALSTGNWIPAAIVLLILAGLLGVTIPATLFTAA